MDGAAVADAESERSASIEYARFLKSRLRAPGRKLARRGILEGLRCVSLVWYVSCMLSPAGILIKIPAQLGSFCGEAINEANLSCPPLRCIVC
jgi:hypothetical protein